MYAETDVPIEVPLLGKHIALTFVGVLTAGETDIFVVLFVIV